MYLSREKPLEIGDLEEHLRLLPFIPVESYWNLIFFRAILPKL
jgi:hypothetical protein